MQPATLDSYFTGLDKFPKPNRSGFFSGIITQHHPEQSSSPGQYYGFLGIRSGEHQRTTRQRLQLAHSELPSRGRTRAVKW